MVKRRISYHRDAFSVPVQHMLPYKHRDVKEENLAPAFRNLQAS